MRITTENCQIEKDGKMYRVVVEVLTHKLHTEPMNLKTAVAVRDKLVYNN